MIWPKPRLKHDKQFVEGHGFLRTEVIAASLKLTWTEPLKALFFSEHNVEWYAFTRGVGMGSR